MKVVLFLSRFTFICNIAFLLFVFFRWIESGTHVKASGEKLIPVPFVQEVIITLGFSALIINLVMNLFYLGILMLGRIKALPSWLVITNFLFLLLEIFYFFFYKRI
jgi:hypothetical protein